MLNHQYHSRTLAPSSVGGAKNSGVGASKGPRYGSKRTRVSVQDDDVLGHDIVDFGADGDDFEEELEEDGDESSAEESDAGPLAQASASSRFAPLLRQVLGNLASWPKDGAAPR